MIEIIQKYKTIIIRLIGAFMLVIGFAVHFWETPKQGFTKAELAAANVARMEASVLGNRAVHKANKANNAPFFKEYKNTKEKQMQYLTILAMILGAGFLLYSFVKKD